MNVSHCRGPLCWSNLGKTRKAVKTLLPQQLSLTLSSDQKKKKKNVSNGAAFHDKLLHVEVVFFLLRIILLYLHTYIDWTQDLVLPQPQASSN